MGRTKTVLVGGLGLVAGAAVAWTLRRRRETEQVPYTVVERVDGVELRHYPAAVAVETTAASGREAFGRLFRYIDGNNREREALPMTAPVETVDRGGREIPMTAPVSTTERGDGTRMAFYLPPEYDYRRAPEPTEAGVHLVAVPERTVAVRRFSWWATGGRVATQTRRLDETLARTGYVPTDEPSLLQYDAPWTLPFLRRNEVAVPVRPA